MLLLTHEGLPLNTPVDQTPRQKWREQVYMARVSYKHQCDSISRRVYFDEMKFTKDIGYIAEMRLLQVCLPILNTLDTIQKRIVQIAYIAKGISYAPPRYR